MPEGSYSSQGKRWPLPVQGLEQYIRSDKTWSFWCHVVWSNMTEMQHAELVISHDILANFVREIKVDLSWILILYWTEIRPKWRWCSIIYLEISLRHSEIHARDRWHFWWEGQIDLDIISIAVVRKAMWADNQIKVLFEKKTGPSTDPCGTPMNLGFSPTPASVTSYLTVNILSQTENGVWLMVSCNPLLWQPDCWL